MSTFSSQPETEKPLHEVNPSGSTLSFLHLSYQVDSKRNKGKLLVDDVSVTVKAGELLAIMVGRAPVTYGTYSHCPIGSFWSRYVEPWALCFH
jgi:hypothetical protein